MKGYYYEFQRLTIAAGRNEPDDAFILSCLYVKSLIIKRSSVQTFTSHYFYSVLNLQD